MKLILASSGFNCEEAVQKCIEFVGKPASEISFAIISEAKDVEHGDHRWFLNDMDTIRNNFGGNIEFVDLLALDSDKIKERIAANDVIFVAGGNTDYLKTVFDKIGFSEILPELLKSKVYVGSSAGAMVLGHRLYYNNEIYREIPYADEFLNLVDAVIMPHFRSSYFMRKDRCGLDESEKWAIDDSKKEEHPVYAISDDAAVIVDGDKVSVIGNNYLVAENGKVVQREVAQ